MKMTPPSSNTQRGRVMIPAHTPAENDRIPNIEKETGLRRARIHMHPAKRRLIFSVALGSLLGAVLMITTVVFIVRPLQRWYHPVHQISERMDQLDESILDLHFATAESTLHMKDLLHQMQKLHASSTIRTGLVEKAAAQSFREHAHDRLRQHFMAIKEGILLHTSQHRRINDAAHELRQMNRTEDFVVMRMYSESTLDEQAQAVGIYPSASSKLANTIRAIRLSMLEASIDHNNYSVFANSSSAAPNIFIADNSSRHEEESHHGILSYVMVFGVLGAWVRSVMMNEATRKKSVVFQTHRAISKWLSRFVVIERIDDDATIFTDKR